MPDYCRYLAQWQQPTGKGQTSRPSRANSNRYSVASSLLERVQEESPTEPNRKSYVSFDSGSDTTNVNVTDPDGNIVQSYFEDGSTEAGGSLREISQALNDDGEDADEELQSFLAGDSWDDSKWMKGALMAKVHSAACTLPCTQ